jgi:hypothetical protein
MHFDGNAPVLTPKTLWCLYDKFSGAYTINASVLKYFTSPMISYFTDLVLEVKCTKLLLYVYARTDACALYKHIDL